MPSTGGAPRRLLSNFLSAACPVWSPENHSLLMEAVQTPADAIDIWSVPLNDEHGNERAAATGIARISGPEETRFSTLIPAACRAE